MSRAAFLDRDGVLNELVWFEEAGIVDSPFHEDHMRLIPGAAEAVRRFRAAGYTVVVVSNQPVVAKGHCSRVRLDRITRRMHELLACEGARVDAVYYCLYHPEARRRELRLVCECRKPRPGLLLRAAAERGLDLRESVMIGDGITDVQAGHAAGCRTVLIGRARCDLCRHLEQRGCRPDWIHSSLLEAARDLIHKEAEIHASVHRHGQPS